MVYLGNRWPIDSFAISRAKLTESNLAAAFKEVVNNKEMQAKSAKLGELIRAETGLENAVRLIKDVL